MDKGKDKSANTATLVLELDLLTFSMNITGQFPNLDAALAMLDQARRALELQHRTATVKALQAQAIEQQENQRIAQQIRRTV